MIAADVALAFNATNERKTWAARPLAKDGAEVVHFTAPANLVTLVLECDTGRFRVQFNKVHAAWGDYVRAIARSLHIVLSTLKASGQPFDAPETADGIEIVATATDGATVYVRWSGDKPDAPAAAIMPELRNAADETA